MPFLDHIAELRWRILLCAAVIAILTLPTYAFAGEILNLLLYPIKSILPSKVLYITGPFEGFTFRFKVSMWAALIIASPLIIWQAMAFFLPALRPKERRWFLPTVIAMVVLFLTGLVFCYFVILYPAVQWMLSQAFGPVANLPFAQQYASGVMLLMLAFGISFEVPVIIFYLIAFNVVPYAKFRENWRYVYVGLAIFAAVATPDWSPITMGSLFFALIILYEGSLFLAKIVFSRRLKRLALEEEAE